ncbi:MAG: GNAT family N-acetyltransferase [Burkholderiales bacterium]
MTASIPVQRLSANAKDAYRTHLLALPPADVRLRFGAPMAAAAIAAYVDRIDFDADEIFGVLGDAMRLDGAAHLAFADEFAELGVSVLPSARGRGIGHALVARAAEHARNRSVPRLFMHCLAENAAMVRIARKAGMDVIVHTGEADAQVTLPPMTPTSLASEALADRIALYDYALKSNVEGWRRVGIALAGGKSP